MLLNLDMIWNSLRHCLEPGGHWTEIHPECGRKQWEIPDAPRFRGPNLQNARTSMAYKTLNFWKLKVSTIES